MELLQETYIGKTSILQQMEDILGSLRKKYSYEWAHSTNYILPKINRDALLVTLGDYIKEQFGFGTVIITVVNDTKLRASTLGFLSTKEGIAYTNDLDDISLKNAIMITSEGPKFDTKKFSPEILVILSTGILFTTSISTGGIVAALLHEIGHSFSKGILGSQEFDRRIEEKYADSFAVMYGYGAELNSVLSKVSTYNLQRDLHFLRKTPIINVFAGLKDISVSLFNRITADVPHTSLIKRMNDTISQLEYELSKADITPQQRQDLLRDIQRAKQITAAYCNDSPSLGDKVYKMYLSNIEPNLPKERRIDTHADKFGSAQTIESMYNKMYESQKGYFKTYQKK